MKTIEMAIKEEFPHVKRDLELLKEYDKLQTEKQTNSDILELIRTLLPKTLEGKMLLGALSVLLLDYQKTAKNLWDNSDDEIWNKV